jgi:hypothetical protein
MKIRGAVENNLPTIVENYNCTVPSCMGPIRFCKMRWVLLRRAST